MSASRPARMPVLFIGHGSPMNAIERNDIHRSWKELGRRLPRPRAVLCISAHWETQGVAVTAGARPPTIHDFKGFPQALFDVQYPAPGDPGLARRTADLLAGVRTGATAATEMTRGVEVRLDDKRGLDHGTWSVCIAMYPDADVPVVQLSLDMTQPGPAHFALGAALAPLRDEGVLVIGSGNIVHNLPLLDREDKQPAPWAARCDADFRRRIEARDHAALAAYPTLGPDARLGIPTPEHYLPLLYALALRRSEDAVDCFNTVVTSTISMTSLVIGAAP